MSEMKPVTKGFLIGGVILVLLAACLFLNVSRQSATHILRVNTKNASLQSAITEAKKGLPGFIKLLTAAKPGQAFAVKGTFHTLEGPEYIWVRTPSFQNGKFTGKLDQQPIAVKGKNKGDVVTFPKEDAVDWLVKDDLGIHGAYTEKALSQSTQSSPN